MRSNIIIASVCAVFASISLPLKAAVPDSSTIAPPALPDGTEDNQWKKLSAKWDSGGPSDRLALSDRTSLKKARAKHFVELANEAKDFREKNPLHPKARQAKKVEGLSALLAADSGAVEEEPRAVRLCMSFRNDTTNDERERYEVAANMADFNIRKKGPRSHEDVLNDYEKKADDLIAEFPDNAEVYRTYLGIMKFSPEAKARKIANKILLRPAPVEIKEQAQAFIDRLDAVGTKFPLEFVSTSGASFDISEQKGKVVVVYIWTAESPSTDAVFAAMGKLPPSVVVAGVNIDQDANAANTFAAAQKAPGIQYTDARGLKSPVAARLKVFEVPSCYVFNPDGALVGFGSVEQVRTLLSKASQ